MTPATMKKHIHVFQVNLLEFYFLHSFHRLCSGLSPDGGWAPDLAVWDALPEHAAAGGDALLAVPLLVSGDLQSHEHRPPQGKQPGRELCN